MFITVASPKRRTLLTGFTVIELVIVIGIVVTISLVMLTRLQALGTDARVKASADLVLNTLRDARNRSSSIREYAPGSNRFPTYGVYFDMATPQQIILYADCKIDDNGDGKIDDLDDFTYNPSSTNCAPDSPANGLVQTIALDPGVRIKAIRKKDTATGPAVSQSRAYVEYLRPEPSIWISVADPPPTPTVLGVGLIEIDIGDASDAFQKTIVVWTSSNIQIK